MASNVRDTRLAAVQSAGRFSDAVIDELARYLTESPDEKLFRMNPFRYAAETGTEESTAVELFLYAAHAGVLEFSWGVICPICGAFVRTEHALRALDQERGCAFCDITISPVMDVNVEVAFSVPVMVGNAVHCKAVTDALLRRHHIYVQPINYPTVPVGAERMRFTPTPLHTDEQIDHLIAALTELWQACPVENGKFVRIAAA